MPIHIRYVLHTQKSELYQWCFVTIWQANTHHADKEKCKWKWKKESRQNAQKYRTWNCKWL